MTILYYLAKYWYVGVIASLICTLVWNNSEHNKKYMELKEEYSSYKEAILLAEIEAERKRSVTQELLYDKHAQYVAELTNAIKDINKQYIINVSELNGLHKTVDNNKDSISTATHSSLVGYTSTLSDLFKECSGMVTELAARADEATVTAVGQHKIMVDQKQILDQLNSDLAENADEIEVVELPK